MMQRPFLVHTEVFAPDGSKVYVSNESTTTLDVFGSATLHLEPAARPGAPLASGTQLPSDADKNMLAKADSRIDSLAREIEAPRP